MRMAAYSTTLVVLANSCKHNGRCVAGKAITDRRFGRSGFTQKGAERFFSSLNEASVRRVLDMRLNNRSPELESGDTFGGQEKQDAGIMRMLAWIRRHFVVDRKLANLRDRRAPA